jgi:predicted alpha/beta hydrolase family esterase
MKKIKKQKKVHTQNIKEKSVKPHLGKSEKKASNVKSVKDRKRVIVVHGWSGDISKGWFPWLKENLESRGFEVIMEPMPSPESPNIEEWVPKLRDISGNVDDNTYFIGHSIGCQTIIRMLEKLESEKAGGAVFVAGWLDLKDEVYKENPKLEKQTRKIAKPWIDTEIDFTKVQSKFYPGRITAIFSDDDPYVDISNAEMFKQKLGARILIENGKGHYSETEIEVLPIIVEEILRISRKK